MSSIGLILKLIKTQKRMTLKNLYIILILKFEIFLSINVFSFFIVLIYLLQNHFFQFGHY
jgi:hypothetical protein